MDCSPSGFSMRGILQARILEWVAIPFSRGSSLPRDRTWVSHIAGKYFFPCGREAICISVQFSSVAQSCLTLCEPMNCSTPGLPVYSWSLPKLMSFESVMPTNHLIPCHPLLLLPSVFPNIRVFSNESALHIRWPKYWSFSFSISPSNEHPGLMSFRIDWLDLVAVQGTLNSLL